MNVGLSFCERKSGRRDGSFNVVLIRVKFKGKCALKIVTLLLCSKDFNHGR